MAKYAIYWGCVLSWVVRVHKRVLKKLSDLPEEVVFRFDVLLAEMRKLGPVRGNWKNYSKLGASHHHCHIKSGRPTYVACWEVQDHVVKIVEVYYVGTHENAPY